ncbi:hypothetical protein [Secundilactobacillus collinoides]|uniref:hypothetical protein n=1 Tax=Secundilactobacillus collinoides TaxID=33960 RepID=UPI000A875B38|nr:hypothetical protein [Secundilactobacillus collinoides]
MKKILRKRITKITLGVIAGILVLVGLFWPLPYYIETPGSGTNLKSFVSIKKNIRINDLENT